MLQNASRASTVHVLPKSSFSSQWIWPSGPSIAPLRAIFNLLARVRRRCCRKFLNSAIKMWFILIRESMYSCFLPPVRRVGWTISEEARGGRGNFQPRRRGKNRRGETEPSRQDNNETRWGKEHAVHRFSASVLKQEQEYSEAAREGMSMGEEGGWRYGVGTGSEGGSRDQDNLAFLPLFLFF